ncbi:ABC transporter C family member 4-like [Capsicum chacoense]
MDSTVSGYATTSLFSKAVWVSINPLLSTGYQSPLKLDEVPLLPPDFQAVRTSEFLQKNFPKPVVCYICRNNSNPKFHCYCFCG